MKDEERTLNEVRVGDIFHVALFGNIQISTQAIQNALRGREPLTYFSMGGWFYGITRGHGLKNVLLRMEQFRLARDQVLCLWRGRSCKGKMQEPSDAADATPPGAAGRVVSEA